MAVLKNRFKNIILLALSAGTTLVLAPILLKTTYKAEALYFAPPLSNLQKVELINIFKNYPVKSKFLQIDAVFVHSGMDIESRFLQAPKEVLAAERDTLKIQIVSDINNEREALEEITPVLENIYSGFFRNTKNNEEQILQRDNLLKKLELKEKAYYQALSSLQNNRASDIYKREKFEFLLGASRSSREAMLMSDIFIIQKMIEDIKMRPIGPRTLSSEEINYIEGSFKATQFGPHVKEFLIYLFVITLGNILFAIETKYLFNKK